MEKSNRAWIELEQFAKRVGGGVDVHYTAILPPIIDGIPHPYSCFAGITSGEHYIAYGVTRDQAILNCYQKYLEA